MADPESLQMAVELESRATSTEVNPSAHKLGGPGNEEPSRGQAKWRKLSPWVECPIEMAWKCHGNAMEMA